MVTGIYRVEGDGSIVGAYAPVDVAEMNCLWYKARPFLANNPHIHHNRSRGARRSVRIRVAFRGVWRPNPGNAQRSHSI